MQGAQNKTVRSPIWKGIDLVEAARAGSTAFDIARKLGVTSAAVRSAAYVRQIALPVRPIVSMRGPREHIADMTPIEAIEYLLDLIETQMPQLQPQRPHALDRAAPKLRGVQRLMVAALVDAAPRMLTYDNLYSIAYDQRPAGDCPSPDVVKVHMCQARQKLPPSFGKIVNFWGRGYGFVKTSHSKEQDQ